MRSFVLVKKVGSTSTFLDGAFSQVTLLRFLDHKIDDEKECSFVSYYDNKGKVIDRSAVLSNGRLSSIFNILSGSVGIDDLNGKSIVLEAVSKGKGFAGVMKRHGFRGGGASHGVSLAHRVPGSTGQCQDPGKVFKGKKMPGRLGGKKVTMKGIKIVGFDLSLKCVIVKGSIPGYKSSILKIKEIL